MKKLFLNVALITATLTTAAQVGIGSTTPQATLDVEGVNPPDAGVADGIIAPRISRANLIAKTDTTYDATKTGAIIYVIDTTGTTNIETANVTAAGYYYFDGAIWQPFVGANKFVDGTPNATDAVYTSGNVGIGTTAPTSRLDVIGFSGNSSTYGINVSNSVGDVTTKLGFIKTPAYNNAHPPVLAFGLQNQSNSNSLFIGGSSSTHSAPTFISFMTDADTDLSTASSIERMRITQNGNVGIGTTIPNAKFYVNQADPSEITPFTDLVVIDYTPLEFNNLNPDLTKNSGGITFKGWNSLNEGGIYIQTGEHLKGHMLFTVNNSKDVAMVINQDLNIGIGTTIPGYKLSVAGQIRATGLITGNTTITSDVRLKKDIVSISNALDKINALNPVHYSKKEDLESTNYNLKEFGFIAQDLKDVLPTLVKEGNTEDKILSVNYTALIPLLTKAIQEQQSQIESLKAEINELKK